MENVEVAATYGNRSARPDLKALLASLALDRYAARPARELNSAQQKTLDLGSRARHRVHACCWSMSWPPD